MNANLICDVILTIIFAVIFHSMSTSHILVLPFVPFLLAYGEMPGQIEKLGLSLAQQVVFESGAQIIVPKKRHQI